MTTAETIFRKTGSGWKATTHFSLGTTTDEFQRTGERMLTIETGKAYNGGIRASARGEIHGSGFVSHAFGMGGGGDFRKDLLQSGTRCTEKAVREMHAQALLNHAETVLAEAKAFYDAKTKAKVAS